MSNGNAVYGEMEIRLQQGPAENVEVELLVSDPQTQGERAPARWLTRLSLAALTQDLLQKEFDPPAYSVALTDFIFPQANLAERDEKVRALDAAAKAAFDAKWAEQAAAEAAGRELYATTKAAFDADNRLLRLRLTIERELSQLHGLRWELLCDPQTRLPLATTERLLFSRFMLSQNARSVRLKLKSELKALIAVAAPNDLTRYRLAEIDKADEIARARAGLAGMQVSVVAENEPLTLNRLIDAVRAGADVLYLVCHGALLREEDDDQLRPFLFLQREDGGTDRVPGHEFAQRIGELPEAPRLIVLASCESAGREGDDILTVAEKQQPDGTRTRTETAAQAALAPRLAEAGVAAIIAMQGKISMKTVERAIPKFFSELLKDGQVDRALAVARGAVRERQDSWMPALFLRLKQGRIWYEPGFAGGTGAAEFEKWDAICHQVRKGEFIPILGPELGRDAFGGTAELACALAQKHNSPLAPHDCDDLAKVSQYLSTRYNRTFAQEAVEEEFQAMLTQRLGLDGGKSRSLPETLALALERGQRNPDDPYFALAKLDAAIYLNASPDPTLLYALRAVQKKPEAVSSAWRGQAVPQRPAPTNPNPTSEQPWVYYVFGRLGRPDTLVLTEDDFFDYLIASSKLDLLLPKLTGNLVQSSLLFLGFRLDDWRFRVLLRMIVTTKGAGTMRDLSHVGVQVNPDENNFANLARARRYLETYFEEGKGDAPRISIYWGTPSDFLRELHQRLAGMKAEPTAPLPQGGTDGWD